jgi:hypothetical protein
VAKPKAWFTDDVKRQKFLTAIRSGATVLQACDAAKWSFALVDGWMREDERIRLDIENAKALAPAIEASREQDKLEPPKLEGGKFDRWKRARDEAAKLGPGMLGFVLYLDNLLASDPGAHTMSEWLRWTLGEFYASGKHEFWMCAGRGFSKSTNFTKVVTAECIFAESDTPPGEEFVCPVLSVDLDEANNKVPWIKRALFKVGYNKTDVTIHEKDAGRTSFQFADAHGKEVIMKCFPATVKAMSGPTLRCAFNDELAKWQERGKDGESFQTNSATQVLSAQGGAWRTLKNKRCYNVSSAWLTSGPHYERIKRGDNEIRFVARIGERFLDAAKAGFYLVANKLDACVKHDDAERVRTYANALRADSPCIPSWLGNPNVDPWDGYLKQDENLDDWFREFGSVSSDQIVAGNAIRKELIERGRLTIRIASKDIDGRYAAIDTGESENPAALGIVERVVHEVRLGTAIERRYQWRPHRIEQWERKPKDPPLDLRGVVLPSMARIIVAEQCVLAWWSDGYASGAVQTVGAEFGIQTIFVATSEQWRDIYEPLATALAETPCPVVLSGRDLIELAIKQLGQTMKIARKEGYSVAFPREGKRHAECGQVLARALAHAGIGTMPQEPERFIFGDDRYSAHRRSLSSY